MRGGRSAAESMRGRRRRARDWVRKGGFLYASILSIFVVLGLGIWLLSLFDPEVWEPQTTVRASSEIALLALVVLIYAAVIPKAIMPWTITPERFTCVSQAASDWRLETVPPETLVFNRRLVAGQVGDGHRGIARWEGSHSQCVRRVMAQGVSKHSVPADQVGKRIRLGEIPHVVLEARLGSSMIATVVATLVDDPPTLLEPYDTAAVRFESDEFNQAVRVMSDSRRTGHFVFDPRLLALMLGVAHLRPRLLWEGQSAFVGAELELIHSVEDMELLEAILDRMVHNAAIQH